MHNKEYSKNYIDSISNNFNVQSSQLGSRVIVFHNQIIIKQVKLLCKSKAFVSFTKSLTLCHGQVINFVSRQENDAATTENLIVDLQRACL